VRRAVPDERSEIARTQRSDFQVCIDVLNESSKLPSCQSAAHKLRQNDLGDRHPFKRRQLRSIQFQQAGRAIHVIPSPLPILFQRGADRFQQVFDSFLYGRFEQRLGTNHMRSNTSVTGRRGFCGQFPGRSAPTDNSMTGTSFSSSANSRATASASNPIIGVEPRPSERAA